MMADLVSQIEGVRIFFCECFLFYRIFSILRLQLRILDYAIVWIFNFFSSYWSIFNIIYERTLLGRITPEPPPINIQHESWV
jgi:hypothetical protein